MKQKTYSKDSIKLNRIPTCTFVGLKIRVKLEMTKEKHSFQTFLLFVLSIDSSCLMWNLRSISIRTENDSNIWFDNQSKTEHETWEYFLAQPSSMIQFQLEMSVYEKFPWLLELEISSDEINGWSNWAPLIPPCNQTETYCEDQISTTSSRFWSNLFIKKQNVTIPIPDDYV